MKLNMRIIASIMFLSFVFIFTMCDKDDDAEPQNNIVKNQDGETFDLSKVYWKGVSPTTGESTGEACSFGDIGMSYSTGVINGIVEYYSFNYNFVRSYQLEGGNWMNEFDLVCTSSDSYVITEGATYYATLFVGRDNDYLNFTFDENKPYPLQGYQYPSSSFPMMRQFVD